MFRSGLLGQARRSAGTKTVTTVASPRSSSWRKKRLGVPLQNDYILQMSSTTGSNINPTNNMDSTQKKNENGEEDAFERVYDQMKMDGKSMAKPTSTVNFLGTLLLGVPLWITVLVPMALFSQLVNKKQPPPKQNDLGESTTTTTTAPLELSTGSYPEPNTIPREKRAYDIILLGATGFTGQLAVEYLTKQYGVNGPVKWAIAGRNSAKLDQVKEKVAKELNDSSILKVNSIIVDTSDLSTLPSLVSDTRVVMTTAGPFIKYGSNVVEFCARYGTHYVDITGEVDWNREMIYKWDATAQATGAKIISFCGHDSIPWDLTVLKLEQLMEQNDSSESLESVDIVNDIFGGVSGGTIDTALHSIEHGTKPPTYNVDPFLKQSDGSKSPYAFKDKNPSFVGRQIDGRFASQWTAPFVMSAINAQIVKRSHATRKRSKTSTANNDENHRVLSYSETQLKPDFKTAVADFFQLVIGVTALLNPLTAKQVKKILPKPGEGPSRSVMERGYLTVTGVGTGSKQTQVESVLYFPHDAGYRDTARMLSESALCLALEESKLPVEGGGFFTPANGMGDVLLNRLCQTGTKFASRIVIKSDGNLKSKL